MKRKAGILAVLLAALVLGGCMVVPLGWHGGGGYGYRGYRGDGPYRHAPYYYGAPRGYWGPR